jgi:hypothetical protein
MNRLGRAVSLPGALLLSGVASVSACGSSSQTGFGSSDGGGSGSGTGTGSVASFGTGPGGSSMNMLTQGDSGMGGSTGPTVTTIYADTDDSLYTLDPKTNTVTLVGAFSGFEGSEGATDVAVDEAGDVYINSEAAVYKAVLPSGGSGPVMLTNRVAIALQKDQSFYALAFAPAGVLGSGETLVGGDNNGELWSIDPTSGATVDLGNFGPNPSSSKKILGLSGDIVFYMNAGTPTGLATIRSCDSDGSDCSSKNDYLAGIDMTALAAAYTSHTPASSLLASIYGGSTGSVGSGTGYGELFGLGAWEGTVFAFGHDPAALYTVSTSSGGGSQVQSTMPDSGWAGAGVSTKTTITVMPPPPVK